MKLLTKTVFSCLSTIFLVTVAVTFPLSKDTQQSPDFASEFENRNNGGDNTRDFFRNSLASDDHSRLPQNPEDVQGTLRKQQLPGVNNVIL